MMTFSQAVEAAKQGKKITRAAWGEGQYIALSTGISYTSISGDTVAVSTNDPEFILVLRSRIRGDWAAGAEDMLAEDWNTVE